MSKNTPPISIDTIRLGRFSYRLRPADHHQPREAHPLTWELIVVLRGVKRIELSDKSLVIKRRGAVLIAPGVPHAISILADENCLRLSLRFTCDWPRLEQVANHRLEVNDRCTLLIQAIIDVYGDDALAVLRRRAFLALILTELCYDIDEGEPPQVMPPPTQPLARQVVEYLRENLKDGLQMQALCKLTGYSASRLRYLFREATGLALTEAMFRLRIEEAQRQLRLGPYKIGAIAQLVGFKQASKFSRFFRERTGLTPRDFAKTYGVPGHYWKGETPVLDKDQQTPNAATRTNSKD